MKISKSIGILSLGSGLSQLISLIGIIFLSRLFSPAEFGIYAVQLGVALIIGAISSLRYEMTILQPSNAKAVLTAISTSILLSMVMNILFLTVVLVSLALGYLGYHWLLIPIVSFCSSIISIASFEQNRNQKYFKLSAFQILKSTLFVSIAILCGVFIKFEYALLVSMTLASVIPALILFTDLSRKITTLGNAPQEQYRRNLVWIRKNRDFAYFSSPAVFVGSLSGQAPIFLLAYLFGEGAAGIFSMIHRLILSPVALVSGAVNRVYMQKVSSLIASKKAISNFTKKLISKFIFPSFVIAIGMYFIFENELVTRVFGEEWRGIDQLALLMIPVFLTSFIAKSIAGFAVIGKNKIGLIYQVCLLLVVSSSIVLAKSIDSSLTTAFVCLSIAFVSCYSVQAMVILRLSRKIDENLERTI